MTGSELVSQIQHHSSATAEGASTAPGTRAAPGTSTAPGSSTAPGAAGARLRETAADAPAVALTGTLLVSRVALNAARRVAVLKPLAARGFNEDWAFSCKCCFVPLLLLLYSFGSNYLLRCSYF